MTTALAAFAGLPIALVFALVILAIYDRNVRRWMAEREETLKQVQEERREWLAWQSGVVDHLYRVESKLLDVLITSKVEEGDRFRK